ncbi:MAG: HEAT repeat domain-containing protein [Deltaproteobacteria bacterium]|nr:HEAT repeat domain-containing protein [Deltaproteobacteria bacterium]
MTLVRALRGGEFTSPASKDHYAPDRRLEPVHLTMRLRVDPSAKRMDAAITHRIRANASGAQSLTLDGVDFEELSVEGAEFDYDGRSIALRFDTPFTKGEEREVTLRYQVVEPVSGLMFHGPSADDPKAPTFAATDHETERAQHWLATVDHPSVRPTLRFEIRADAALTILANGALESETTHDDGTKTAIWNLEQPCPAYLTCFAVGDFVRWDGETVDGTPVAAFAPAGPFTEAHLERSFRRTSDMLHWLPEHLGTPFPYPKYFQIALPFIGGAMENISLVTWDDRFLLDEAMERDERQLMDVINVHEMAHTWFGDLIVCKDFSHGWLKESWATYTEACWLDHDQGRDARDHDLWRMRNAYVKESKERYARPIVTRRFDSSWDMYDMHLYPGGAWRLHMLREQLGDEVFWPAVKDYVATYANRVVETDDFRRVLEEHSGRDLSRFFDQWLRSAGFPELEGRFSWDASRKEGIVTLRQTQKNDKQGIPLFAFDLELSWTIDGHETVRTVRFEEEKLRLTFPMEKAPELFRVDPGLKLLHTLKLEPGDRRWRAQLKALDVVGRIQAGEALAGSGKRANTEAVVEAFGDEPFWGVRQAWAQALGNAGSEAAIEGIVTLLESESEPRVVVALAKAAGQTPDDRLRDAILRAMERDPSPRMLEGLLDALGRQRNASDLERLRKAGGTHTFAMAAEAGALRGLGALRSAEAVDALIALMAPGASSYRARAHAVGALGTLSRRVEEPLQERIRDALMEGLRDPNKRVRAAAALALVAARASGARSALESYRATLPFQEQMGLDRQLRRLDRSDSSLRSAEDRIEKLERKMRDLTDRLERIESRSQDG